MLKESIAIIILVGTLSVAVLGQQSAPASTLGEFSAPCQSNQDCNWPQGSCSQSENALGCNCEVGWTGRWCQTPTMPGNLAIDVLSINIGSFDKIPEEEFKAMDGSKRELIVTKDLRNEISRGYKFMVTKPYSAVIRVCSVGLTPSNTDDSTNKIQCNKDRIVVPSGFLADGNASGQFNESPAWVFHDWLYAKQKIGSRKISRSEADKITLRIMVKVPILYERDLTQLAMTLAGLFYEASWNLAGKRGPEFALVEGVRRPIDPTGAKQ